MNRRQIISNNYKAQDAYKPATIRASTYEKSVTYLGYKNALYFRLLLCNLVLR